MTFLFLQNFSYNTPELESEFDGWDKIDDMDIPDFKRTQPEMYARHWPEKKTTNTAE